MAWRVLCEWRSLLHGFLAGFQRSRESFLSHDSCTVGTRRSLLVSIQFETYFAWAQLQAKRSQAKPCHATVLYSFEPCPVLDRSVLIMMSTTISEPMERPSVLYCAGWANFSPCWTLGCWRLIFRQLTAQLFCLHLDRESRDNTGVANLQSWCKTEAAADCSCELWKGFERIFCLLGQVLRGVQRRS